jgi:hypothetical protein
MEEQGQEKVPEHNKLEELQESLYSREFRESNNQERPHFANPSINVEQHWKSEAGPGPQVITTPSRLFKRILIGSAIFFVLAAAIAVFVFYRGLNIVSADKINLSFVGPVAIGANEELSFDIVVQNDNNSSLVNPVLYINFPEGTKAADDRAKDLLNETVNLEEIPMQNNVRRTVRVVLYGEQSDTQEIKVALEYGVKNSNAKYRKEKTYPITLSSTPLVLNISAPKQISSGDTVEVTAEVVSNSNTNLTGLLLKAEYPLGFEYVSSDPKPVLDNNIWSIPVLKPAEHKTFTIRGKLEGLENDERPFKFQIGTKSDVNDKQIATVFLNELETVTLNRPLVSIDFSIEGSTAKEVILNSGGMIHAELELTNNMPTELLDGQVKIVFGGSALDPSSPQSDNSVYRLNDKTMIWDKNSLPALVSLAPGRSVDLAVKFNTLSDATLGKIQNGSITVAALITGTQVVSGSSPQPVSVAVNRIIKFKANANLSSRLLYGSGPFKNTGPIPPKVDAKTTYSVVWSLPSPTNPLSGAEVKGVLPAYVRWMGAVSPSGENVTYNADTREIVWHIGDMKPGMAKREAAFQVEVQPLNAQVGIAPAVVMSQAFTATDTFANTKTTDTVSDLTTATPTDLSVKSRDGIVRK